MSVETFYAVSRGPAPSLEDTMLGLDRERYETELMDAVHSLGALATMSLQERRAVAFAIVGEDVPEAETREALRARYWSESDNSRAGMLALDGGYHAMWARARTT